MRALLTSLFPLALFAAGHPDLLISPDALAAKLNDPSLVVLHVGTVKDYEPGHIPGARLVTLADLSVTGPAGLRLEMPPLEKLRETLLRLGVANGKRVVIYPGNESIQSATRVWFTFDYLGWGDRAALLDGGLSGWKAAGKPLSAEVPAAVTSTGKLTLKPHPEYIVDAAWLSTRIEKPALRLIDARLPEFYTGVNNSGMPRAGRIPGAVNVPFPSLLTVDRKLLPEAELKAKLDQPAKELVTYCHIGQQATVPYFIARYLGLKPKLYDGSFQDWSGRPELPVIKDGPAAEPQTK
jgi:thiosulfate/3-mercaptopyruvate sulfurtransferase